jgi:hypothetical protein
MNLDSLKELAAKLPESHKQNALDLLERMESVVEGIGDEPIRWRAPMLRLLQATSDRSKLPKGVGAGDFMIGEEKVDQPLPLIILTIYNTRQYWSPDKDEAKMLCSSPDAKVGFIGLDCNKCPHGKFDEEARKSECGKVKQALAITADFKEIVVVNFSKTNYAIGTELEGFLKKAGVAPYRRIYNLSSKTNAKYKNVEQYVVEPATGAEKNVATELVDFLKELFEVVRDDRKESLEKFYEIIQVRREQGTTPALTNESADSVVMIEGPVETADAGGDDGLASKYSV